MEWVHHVAEHWNDALAGAVVWWVLSAVSHSLPEPEPMGSRVYLFCYRLVHWMMANRPQVTAAEPKR